MRDLPEPVRLRGMIGPGIVAAGIGLAAGEIILWPYITAMAGFGLLWLALVTVLLQSVINMEIERYTLATGQTVVAGFSRWWKGWGVIICAAGAFQYAWPGWATSAATVFTFTVGGGDPLWVSVISLFVIGILLTASPVVYRTVEKAELIKVGLTLFFLAVVVVAVLGASTWAEAGTSAVAEFGQVPAEIPFALMLSAIGAAGAGGVHNLVLSNWIRDKGYGMGRHVPVLVSPITGREEPAGTDRYTFPDDERNAACWKVWWRRANVEHAASFTAVSIIAIGLMCMLAYETLFGRGDIENSPEFLRIQGELLGDRVGPWLELLFFSVATVSLWAAALGLIDIIGRVISDFVKRNYLESSTRWTEGRLYLAVVWGEVLLGTAILLSGMDQPVQLLLISTCAASVVTLLYAALLLRLNRRDVPATARIGRGRTVALSVAVAFYAFFAIATLISQLSGA
ncbi:Nramp family divalent metal transporter [Nocardiopsis coralliicola]